MAKLIVTTRKGETHTVEASTGLSVMEVIRDSSISDADLVKLPSQSR